MAPDDSFECEMCGKKIDPDFMEWDEEENGWLCNDCQVEKDACGCSD